MEPNRCFTPEQIAHLAELVDLQVACGVPNRTGLANYPTTVDDWVLYWARYTTYIAVPVKDYLRRHSSTHEQFKVFEDYFNSLKEAP